MDRHCASVVVVSDLAEPIDRHMASLPLTEQKQVEAYPTERRRRHFILGRLAAHTAARKVLGARADCSSIEVLTAPSGQPLIGVDGMTDVLSVSLTHSGRLAAACAWFNAPDYSAGVDLERIRPTEVGQSEVAFSRRERTLLAQAPEGQTLAGLAAWTVKEAVWKALQPNRYSSPAAIEVRALSLASGRAAVKVGGKLAAGWGGAVIRAKVSRIDGPDGAYIFSVAEVAPRRASTERRTIWPGTYAQIMMVH